MPFYAPASASTTTEAREMCRLPFHIQLIIYSKPSHPCEATCSHTQCDPAHTRVDSIRHHKFRRPPKNPENQQFSDYYFTYTYGLFKPCDALSLHPPCRTSSSLSSYRHIHLRHRGLFLRHIEKRFHRSYNKKAPYMMWI